MDSVMRAFRCSSETADLIDQAVRVSSCASRTEWIVEALEAGARRELNMPPRVRQPEPAPTPSMQAKGSVGRDTCGHPVASRLGQRCGLCGAVVQ